MPETKNLRKENSPQIKQLAKSQHETLWLGSRFLEKNQRNLVEAVLAFDAELLKIASGVSDRMIGQIRFQWWRDKLTEDPSDRSRSYTEKLDPVDVLVRSQGTQTKAHLNALIDAREDVFLQEGMIATANQVLFLLLAEVLKSTELTSDTAFELGRLYALTDDVQETAVAAVEIPGLTHLLTNGPLDVWPVLSAFSLLPYWVRNQKISPLRKRWLIWKGFLSGERALLMKLSDVAQASTASS